MSIDTSDNDKSLQLSQKVVSLIHYLFAPKSSTEVTEMIASCFNISKPEVDKVVDSLVQAGVLLQGSLSMRDQSTLYSGIYSDTDNQKAMLLDWHRTNSYKQAIEETVSPGDNVIDVGAGSGILSLFAASAGAKVHAIEVTSMIDVAKKLAVANNLNDRIEFFNTFAQNVSLDKKVDVIISEWMGMFAMEEYMFDAVQIIRDRFLAQGGKMIPNAVDLYLAPIEDRELYYKKGPGFWKSNFFNYNFNINVKQDNTTDRFIRCTIKPESLISSPALLLHFDCEKDNTSAFHFCKNVEWKVERNAFLHGFCGYFDTILTDRVTLHTSPRFPATDWKQAYFPIEEILVENDDVIKLNITTKLGSTCPEILLKGSILRNNEVISTFQSKPFVNGALTTWE